MTIDRRHFLAGTAAIIASASLPLRAQQKNWPTRPVRLVVPYPPGGSSDIIARVISEPLSAALGQSVVVENKPGASGNVGAGMVVQSADEGHSLLLCDVGALAISPSVYKKLTFNPSKDLRGVSMLAYSPHVLAVHPDVKANTLEEIVEMSRKEQVNFAVTAIGSAPHLAAVEIQQATGAKWDYVPYKGGSQAITDTIGGQCQVILNGLLATLPHIKSGKLRAIAISKAERMSLVPDIPTIAEQGVKGFQSGTWQGIMAPSNMSDATATKLARDFAEIIRRPEITSKLNEQGAEIVVQSPAELDQFFVRERDRWAKIVAQADIRLD